MNLFPTQDNGGLLNRFSKEGRRNISYGQNRALQENKGISDEHIVWVQLSCWKLSSNAETWHYPLQAENASSVSSSVPCRTLLKFALVCECGEWWINGYCFAFLSELLSLSPSTMEGRGSWQGFFWIIQNVNREEGIAILFLE